MAADYSKINRTILILSIILVFIILIYSNSNSNKRKLTETRVWPLYYLKTHKTGSSTLQNIIYRYALKNNLRLAFPKNGDVTFCEGASFRADCVAEEEYEVIANHNKWSPIIDEVLPTAKKISILREPISQTISAFFFFGRKFIEEKTRNITTFEHFVRRDFPVKRSGLQFFNRETLRMDYNEFRTFTHNPQALDLGVTDPVFNASYPQEIADYIIGYYDLILITEFFDESLILLKHLLSLEFTDIVYLKAKENRKKEFTQEDLSQETKELILKRQNIDIVLYNTANATLWRKIDHFGRSKMDDELNKFRKIKEQADPNETLLSLEGKKFMEYMKNQQHYEKFVNS